MKLEPVATSARPVYPPRQKGRRSGRGRAIRLLRNAAVATCAAGALWLGGCYGATPRGTPDDETFFDRIVDYDFEIVQPPLPEEPDISPGAAPAPTSR